MGWNVRRGRESPVFSKLEENVGIGMAAAGPAADPAGETGGAQPLRGNTFVLPSR